MDKERPFHIAIDGPVAAGKGTVAKLLAEKLGFLYVDTGAMYRMTALLALHNHISFDDAVALAELIQKSDMDMRSPTEVEKDGRLSTVFLNGEDVSWEIRTPVVSDGSSKVAQHAQVRSELVKKQQAIAAGQNVVMEGRDITYRVLPDAQLKIYLTANDQVRAQRRLEQLLSKGEDVTFEQVYQDLLERDERDSNRASDPLKKVPEAWEVDTSDLEILQVVELILNKVRELQDD